MEYVIAIAIGILFGSGIWLLLRPRSFQVIMGLLLMSYAVNLFIFLMGGMSVDKPPLTLSPQIDPADHADPLPQALVLTAIVIGFGLATFLLMLAARLAQQRGSLDAEEMREWKQ